MLFIKQSLGIFICVISSYSPALVLRRIHWRKDVIVVVNRNDPDSLAIGQYYAKQRGIPEANIVQLSTSTEETITVTEYVETIANPLLNALLDNDWVKGVKGGCKRSLWS